MRHTGPIQLGQLDKRLASLRISDYNPASNAKISVPPCLVEGTSILRNAKLDVAIVIGFVARWFESSGERVDVTSDHSHAIARLVGLPHRKANDGAAIASNEVFAARRELSCPIFSTWELLRTRISTLTIVVQTRRRTSS